MLPGKTLRATAPLREKFRSFLRFASVVLPAPNSRPYPDTKRSRAGFLSKKSPVSALDQETEPAALAVGDEGEERNPCRNRAGLGDGGDAEC